MPRNGSGVMTKPPNTTAQPNTTILSAMFNAVIDDIIDDLNFPRPISAGGTGGSSVADLLTNFGIDQKFIITSKSGAYTADASNNNGMIIVTATATIALTAAATLGSGWHTIVTADGGVATIDPNGTQKINGATTLVLQDGQAAFVYCTNTVGDEFSAIVFNAARRPFSSKSANYTIAASDDDGDIVFTSAATAAFTAAATLGSGFRVTIRATAGDVLLDPNGSEQINVGGVSAATFVLKRGQVVDVVCNGTLFYADVHSDPLQGPQNQGFYFGLGIANGTDAANDIAVAAGSAAADTSPYYLMQLTGALTKRIDAAWAVGANQGGLDTGSVQVGATYFIWLIQRSDTGVVDALFSLSSTAPTMPTSYDRKRLIGQTTRTGGINGSPSSTLTAFGIKASARATISAVSTFDLTGIPATVSRVRLKMNMTSLSAATPLRLLLGTAAAFITTGYAGSNGQIFSNGAGAPAPITTALVLSFNTTGPFYGIVELTREAPGSNNWFMDSVMTGDAAGGIVYVSAGRAVLNAELTRLQLNVATGTMTGFAAIEWEF